MKGPSLSFGTIYGQIREVVGQDAASLHSRVRLLSIEILKMSSEEVAELERASVFNCLVTKTTPREMIADSLVVKLVEQVKTVKLEIDKFNQAMKYIEEDRYDEAASLLCEIKNETIKPDAETVLGHIVQAYLANGEPEKAEALAQKIQKRTIAVTETSA